MSSPAPERTSVALLAISAADHTAHTLHDVDRVWNQTNCSIDVWIEVLHALGLDPLAAGAFAVATDFEDDQWQFYKYPAEDLRTTYGIDVHEMNPWKGVLAHIVEQLTLGRLMTVEVDSWYLPDTAGVSYRLGHVKSTIVANEVDPEQRRLGYFHNAGYHELEGDDFDGVFRLGAHTNANEMPPYTELVRLEGLRQRDPADLAAHARALLAHHLTLRPSDNPVTRMAERVSSDLAWLQGQPEGRFHDYAFATLRQCGAAAETASAFCGWLADRDPERYDGLRAAADAWLELAQTARSQQLKLARAARGRSADLSAIWSLMENQWATAQSHLDGVPLR